MRLRFVLASALLAACADAQPSLDAPGGYAAYGASSPERLLFPTEADPDVVVGLRVSPRVDVHVGYARRTTESTALSRRDVSVRQRWERTGALVASAGYTGRVGPALVRGRLSVGYDDYSFRSTVYQPDSVQVFTGGSPFPGYALQVNETRHALGKFVHTGLSVSAGVPAERGRLRSTPSAGLAATLSSRTSGRLEAQGARWMPYARLPVTVAVKGIAVTLEATAGLAFGADDFSPETSARRSTASKQGTPVVDGAVRVSF